MSGEFNLLINADTSLLLDANRTIWIPEHQTLVIADLHAGKVQHFRKHGIPLPPQAAEDNLTALINSLKKRHPKRVVFLGDLFHSSLNSEFQSFIDRLNDFRTTNAMEVILTKGNHDILPTDLYTNNRIGCVDRFELPGILLTHEPIPHPKNSNNVLVCGHLHPGVTIIGKGRNKIKLPCFGFCDRTLYMPSFGNLTGTVSMEWPKQARTWAIIESNQQLLEINASHRR